MTVDDHDVDAPLWEALSALYLTATEALDQLLATRYRLTTPEYHLLAALFAAPEPQAVVALKGRVSPVGLRDTLRGLVDAGLVLVEGCGVDERVRLTINGRDRVGAARRDVRDVTDGVAAPLTAQERGTLGGLLRRMRCTTPGSRESDRQIVGVAEPTTAGGSPVPETCDV
ncbi:MULTISPECIES: MarR family winged helix-turn-helix transcriptional regulator [Actinoalloteichus]|uniref:Transcriptional regulator n=1 Tax=Actinoalloteichus fjordicus TaxID=1612552 RepID=A0AAC9LHL6_9PSEU|nr:MULTISPECIES: MarR family winged helix-turn-helix transcriptional regulator [Actinoalloteichus]APU17727.1 transcriptional regulator [Actinoalloteichus fjordicus]APU23805.1 transcriptional regulator [Actinoalloteichus sp. GBA129-24]